MATEMEPSGRSVNWRERFKRPALFDLDSDQDERDYKRIERSEDEKETFSMSQDQAWTLVRTTARQMQRSGSKRTSSGDSKDRQESKAANNSTVLSSSKESHLQKRVKFKIPLQEPRHPSASTGLFRKEVHPNKLNPNAMNSVSSVQLDLEYLDLNPRLSREDEEMEDLDETSICQKYKDLKI